VITPGSLAYYANKQGSVTPTGPAPGRTRKWRKVALLWGDPMYVNAIDGADAEVFAKGHRMKLPLAQLREEPLLSIYQIDCGQGDAALVNFPDGRWMMVDGGPGRSMSNSGKIAADFLYWKAFVDQSWRESEGVGPNPFVLDAIVCTHPDADHFEGLADMTDRVRQGKLAYGTVFHCGLGRVSGPDGPNLSQLGPLDGSPPDRFVGRLLDGFDDVRKLSRPSGTRRWALTGGYGDWLEDLRSLQGAGVGALQRVSHRSGHLPGYEPGSSAVAVNVLGPVEETAGRLRFLDTEGRRKDPSLTRNGHSVVLRLDYKGVRILLTGDLNFRSQALLLRHHGKAEFASHVAKACHHGSEDISATFLEAMSPLATMISSGDNETHAHPRARMLGLTGAFARLHDTGRSQEFLGLKEKRFVAPLIYSTELSRSIQLFEPFAAFGKDGVEVLEAELQATSARGRREVLARWLLGDRLVYGLINVRTDGNEIVMAVMSEGAARFQLEELSA
jgi:beta-lactamase superfamily II metal-dependent hydrolase